MIGYGNTLRGDDGAGPWVAHAIDGLGHGDVRVIARHQLTPELAADCAIARAVIFVDAAVAEAEVTCRIIEPQAAPTGIGHFGSPGELLALTDAAYGTFPRAWVVAIPAVAFGYGDELSLECRKDCERAQQIVEQILDQIRREGSPDA